MRKTENYSEPIIITIKSRKEKLFLSDINKAYAKIMANKDREILVEIDISDLYIWISANTLIHILTFLILTTNNIDNINIEIMLFSKSDAENISLKKDKVSKIFLKKFTDKLRFYITWAFCEEIYNLQKKLNSPTQTKIQCYPSGTLLDSWNQKLISLTNANQNLFSTTLLPLSSIEEELTKSTHKQQLDRRIRNLTLILWTHMFGNKRETNYQDLQRAEETSSSIMYELVKNIYQHSPTQIYNRYGYTTVQIYKKSIIFTKDNVSFPNTNKIKQFNKYDIAVLKQIQNITATNAETNIRYLAISISDFGPGIPNNLKNSNNNLKQDENVKDDAINMIKKAIFSSYTTKNAFQNDNHATELYLTENDAIKLSPRGYGWIYCAIFIAQNLGSFNITSGNTSITYRTKIDGYKKVINIENHENPLEIAENLLKTPTDIFEEVVEYDETKYAIPGTRIFIEIPIHYKWVNNTNRFSIKNKQSINELRTSL